MPFSFPASPTVGQQSAQNGRTYQWSGYSWDLVSNVPGHASTHASTGSDPITVSAGQITNYVGNRGDITVSSDGATWTINAGAVVTNDIANAAVTRVKLGTAEQSAISLYLWSNFR